MTAVSTATLLLLVGEGLNGVGLRIKYSIFDQYYTLTHVHTSRSIKTTRDAFLRSRYLSVSVNRENGLE